MVQGNDDNAVTYLNSEAGLDSLRMVKAVDHLIYISDTDIKERHRSHSI